MEKKKNKKLKIILIILLIVAVLSAAGVMVWLGTSNQNPSNDSVAGTVVDNWDTHLQSQQTDSAATGIQIPGYSKAEMNAGDTELKLRIGNPSANTCGFYATLMLEDGTKLYESQLLKPGQGMEKVPLNKTLEKGEYKAYVLYRCVTLDGNEKAMNSAESAFTLTVK